MQSLSHVERRRNGAAIHRIYGRLACRLAPIVAALTLGCSDKGTVSNAPPHIQLKPEDLTSSATERQPLVVIAHGYLRDEVLASVLSSTRLKRLSDGSNVPIVASVSRRTIDPEALVDPYSPISPFLSFLPTAPIGPGWYELSTNRVDTLGQAVWQEANRVIKLPNERLGARFYVGSALFLRRLYFCPAKGSRLPTIRILLSEPAGFAPGASFDQVVRILDGEGRNLARLDGIAASRERTQNDAVARAVAEGGRADTWEFWVPALPSGNVVVQLSDGLRNAAGESIRAATPTVPRSGQAQTPSQTGILETLDWQKLPLETDFVCRVWVP